MTALALFVALFAPAAVATAGQTPQTQAQDAATVTKEQVAAAIGRLATIDNAGKNDGSDYAVRMEAARTIRRGSPEVSIPLLVKAATTHENGYIRFRALVLLSGYQDPRVRDVMIQSLSSPNERLRAVASGYFEQFPDADILPRLLDSLVREESQFVRPALTRAIAAQGGDPRARDMLSGLVMKGEDFFRSTVIEALGDYKAAYALKPISDVARQEGRLQGDAVLALGKIGDKASLPTLAALQRTAPRALQPTIAAAICLLGVNCSSHQSFLERTLHYGVTAIGAQDLVRSAAAGLGALAIAGNEPAATFLLTEGAPTRDPARAAIALPIGAIALRNTPLMLKVLAAQADPKPSLELLRESFDMLEEDLAEEHFFVTVRRGYWQAAENSPARKLAAALIRTLEF
jgi:HEAT repeat protein